MPPLIHPAYPRKNCTSGVLHIGVGAFHRAHQAVYFERLLQRGETDWGIAGVNLRADGSALMRKLKARGNRYILKTVSPEGAMQWREVRSILALHNWCESPKQTEELLAGGEVQLVTITATEAGYYQDENGELNAAHPSIAAELRGEVAREGISIYGYLQRALRRRMQNYGAAITILSCDNLRGNGALLRRCFYAYLRAGGDVALCEWLDENASFPSCMVDRITPRPTAELAGETASLFGVDNDATVMAEDYLQWVVEDDFAGARPALDAVGAEMVGDVLPFEEAKIRMLNGGHSSLAYFAALQGFNYFDEAIDDAELRAFFDAYQAEEVVPGLRHALADSPLDYDAYLDSIRARFGNRHLRDSVARIACDGANKITGFILPTVRDSFARGHEPRYAMRVIDAWYQFLRAVRDGRVGFAYTDAKWGVLEGVLDSEGDFFGCEELWGGISFFDGGRAEQQAATEQQGAVILE